METQERVLIETESRSKSNARRIEDLERKTEEIHELALSVRDLANQMSGMLQEQKRQGERLTALEKEPAKQWNNAKRTVVTSVVSTISGALAAALIYLAAQFL